MTHVAFVVSPLEGHVNPLLAVARELPRRGHRVTFHLPATFRSAVEATGAVLAPLELPPPGARLPADPTARFTLLPFEMTRLARRALPQVLDAVGFDPPDLVVYDRLCVWGRLLAQLSPAPAAMVSASFALNDSFSYVPRGATAAPAPLDALDEFAEDMYALSRAYGTPLLGLRDLIEHSEPLTIAFVPRELQPAAASFDDRFVFAGPALRDGDRVLDPELAALGTPPLAYVSLGTLFNDWPAFYDLCFEAFSDAVWNVVLTGPAELAARAPRGVVVRPRVAQRGVLARADVFVTHGGMNSVLEALWEAVPLVLVPQMPEQEVTAELLQRRGAGERLARATLTAGSLRAAVERVAGGAVHRVAVEQLRAVVRGTGGAALAADALISYVGRHAPRVAQPT